MNSAQMKKKIVTSAQSIFPTQNHDFESTYFQCAMHQWIANCNEKKEANRQISTKPKQTFAQRIYKRAEWMYLANFLKETKKNQQNKQKFDDM